jgi:hypothetical protein
LPTGRPNRRTLDILGDPAIRDRAEDATRALQDAANKHAEEGTPAQKPATAKDPARR